MSVLKPNQNTGISADQYQWLEPYEEHQLFEKQVRAIMQMSGADFLRKLDQGEFDAALQEDTDHNLTYLIMLSDLGR